MAFSYIIYHCCLFWTLGTAVVETISPHGYFIGYSIASWCITSQSEELQHKNHSCVIAGETVRRTSSLGVVHSPWKCCHVSASCDQWTWKRLFQIPARGPAMGSPLCREGARSWIWGGEKKEKSTIIQTIKIKLFQPLSVHKECGSFYRDIINIRGTKTNKTISGNSWVLRKNKK